MKNTNLNRPRASQTRGVTLVEVLIVVAILALIATGVGVAAHHQWTVAQHSTAATNARSLRMAVKTWWIDHNPAECPSVDQLVAAGTVDRDSAKLDPWGEPWRVECNNNEVTVISTGRDRQLDTQDDIRVPPT
jgi:general secretion pathway protein G